MGTFPGTLVHLAGAEVSVVVDTGTGAPTILHWGAPLGPGADLHALRAALDRPLAAGAGVDVVAPVSLVPEHGLGYPGRPGLAGRRADGTAWAPRFVPVACEATADHVQVEAVDTVAGLGLHSEVHLEPTGVLRARVTLTNTGDGDYAVDGLTVTLPLPGQASELVTFAGRWCRELHPRRVSFDAGAVLAENRRGRTSHDHLPLLWAGTPGFGEWTGEVWGVHLAWSGNSTVLAEHLSDGRRSVQLGELLHPGEVTLNPGESYRTPWVVAVYHPGGLTPASWAFHRHLRARPVHPRRPRPVLVNTWEAVYFDHDRDTLFRLAERAAALGIERFVLDDGWFGARRDDRRALGDWWVSPEVYPEGLRPLIAHVQSLGMDFGIWVEPEMVSPDSELFRAHPDWALVTAGYEPVTGRHQLVLDLARPDAFAHVLGRLDALLAGHDIAFVKWDMNRDHVQGSGADGRAGTHAQTLAVYRLIDELRRRHPAVEFESCASGGGRIDLGILERAERVWTSDCNDALERQVIQRGASMLIPPELMGAHIGPPTAHTTNRRHPLAFRAATALFGHLGVEWNLLRLDDTEAAALAAVIALHKRFRHLLHTGDVVRFGDPGGAGHAHGVYATDRSEALVCAVQLRTAQAPAPVPLRLPGLDPDRRYRPVHVPLPGEWLGLGLGLPSWMTGPVTLTGRQLAAHGVQLPVLHPATAVLVHLEGV